MSSIEVIAVSVANVDRAVRLYVEQAGGNTWILQERGHRAD